MNIFCQIKKIKDIDEEILAGIMRGTILKKGMEEHVNIKNIVNYMKQRRLS